MSISREVHPTRYRILDRLKVLGPMTKYQIADVCYVSFRNVNNYLKLMHQSREVYVHEYVRSGPVGGSWTKVWAFGDADDAPVPIAQTKAEASRKRRADPEVRIDEMMRKRARRFNERMKEQNEKATISGRGVLSKLLPGLANGCRW